MKPTARDDDSAAKPKAPRQIASERRPRDADATRELLLATAQDAFTRSGFDGARVDDIAERAKVNKRMIYVYFGDKEGLYASVLRRAFGRIARRAKVCEDPALEPSERLRRWIHDYFCFLGSQPELVRLAEWEALADGSRAASALLEVAQQELVDLTALIQAGIAAGQLRSDLEPEQALMAIHALCFGTLSRRRLWSSLWQLELGDPKVLDKVATFLVEVVLKGIGIHSSAETVIAMRTSV